VYACWHEVHGRVLDGAEQLEGVGAADAIHGVDPATQERIPAGDVRGTHTTYSPSMGGPFGPTSDALLVLSVATRPGAR
jgi:hypothetical protein